MPKNLPALLVAGALLASPAAGQKTGLIEVDPSAKPCDNFYQYACGMWVKQNPIPADQAVWGQFGELQDRNEETLKTLLEKASPSTPGRDATDQRIGDFFASCVDEKAADFLGVRPLKADLDAIADLKDKAGLPPLVARLRAEGVNVFADFGSLPDFKNASRVIATVDQGGLGLPDRDSYFNSDAHAEEIRKKYVTHIQNMLILLGEEKARALAHATSILAVETALAKVSLAPVDRRKPENLYHKMTTAELQALSPSFSWTAYVQASGAPKFDSLDVVVPDFVKGLGALVTSTDLETIKTYLRWHVLSENARLLSKPFVDESFTFNGTVLTGQPQIQPRWKRCVQETDSVLGDALGEKYVALTFPPEAKERTLRMVKNLEKALDTDIAELSWMTPRTKTEARAKLEAITNKIGYPDRWRTYKDLKITRDDLVGNEARANAYERSYQLGKIGTPTDKKEWDMTPPTVNADYDPTHNDVNFPAGILQPPFFDLGRDDAVNFGAIGAIIGHELTHGFDDEGRKFGADGSLTNWWTDEDAKEFETRTKCLVDQYGSYTAIGDLKENGTLTLGENTADNGGLRIALAALKTASPASGEVGGFTPEQRFFLGWGQAWCESQHDELARLRVGVDPHANSESRVNGPLSNMPEFQKAFSCAATAPMVRPNACHVW